jgi:hypothetical protein
MMSYKRCCPSGWYKSGVIPPKVIALLRKGVTSYPLQGQKRTFWRWLSPRVLPEVPNGEMKTESKTFNMAYHKIWIHILGYDSDTNKAP